MAAVKPTNLAPAEWDRGGLPPWTYFSDELLEIEKEELFRRHWQLVCHLNDVPETGNYVAIDVVGERALILRGADNQVRAFHNVCRHRGSRVVADDKGSCRSAIVCPFHGWSYNLDGTLRSPAQAQTLPDLDPVEYGLKPLEIEIWNGFVFIRFKPSRQLSIAEILRRFDDEVAPYELSTLVPTDRSFWTGVSEVNWKAVRDVDNEGYHVPRAHPGLQDLYGGNYYDEPFDGGASRSFGAFSDGPGRFWSVRNYKSVLPEATWLPKSHRRAWLYIGVFPNAVFGFYPDSVKFYQEFPLATRKSLIRSATYRRPDEDRRWRLTRYLSSRIDGMTSVEDKMLTIWSSEAALSSGFDGIILSDLEYNVRAYHDELRSRIPVLNCEQAPQTGTLADTNAALLSKNGKPK